MAEILNEMERVKKDGERRCPFWMGCLELPEFSNECFTLVLFY